MTTKRTTITTITGAAKRDSDMKRSGGFSVWRLYDGSIDYFPLSYAPSVTGGKLISRYRWNNLRWSRTY